MIFPKICSFVYLFGFRHFFVLCCLFSVFNIYIYGSHCGCNYQEISTSILLDLCQQVRHPIINSPFLCQHITHIYTYTQIFLLNYGTYHVELLQWWTWKGHCLSWNMLDISILEIIWHFTTRGKFKPHTKTQFKPNILWNIWQERSSKFSFFCWYNSVKLSSLIRRMETDSISQTQDWNYTLLNSYWKFLTKV